MSDNKNSNKGGNFLYYWLILAGVLLVFMLISPMGNQDASKSQSISYTEFWQNVKDGKVQSVTLEGRLITAKIEDKNRTTYIPEGEIGLIKQLQDNNINVISRPERQPSFLQRMLTMIAPVLLLILFFWWMFNRQMGGGGRSMLGFSKSKAKLFDEDDGIVTFDDVAGVDEAQAELEEIVDFLKEPEKFQKLGAKIPKGCLLVGPPGTGKTLLARSVAGEAKVPFFSISGSDFLEMFVGVGASRVRDMFEQAKKHAPCIIFIDEIDAVGRQRGAGLGGGNDEREQTLNQILVEMDGFGGHEGVIILAATNRPDILDPALLRPGRFDRQVTVPRPDVIGREKILQVHMRRIPVADDVSMRTIARGTPGFSGADLANIVNEAALMAARQDKQSVGMEEFERARDKQLMGSERKSMTLIEEERILTAWHEAGHAILQLSVPEADPLHKVTIIPRGQALGVTMHLPEKENLTMNKIRCRSRMVVLFGGRAAEEIALGEDRVTNGATGDIQQATQLARAMVTEWGFTESLGPVRYANNEEEVFLGHSVARQQNMSEKTADQIDYEVKRIITDGLAEARRILNERFDDLQLLTNALLEHETLSGSQVDAVLSGEPFEQEAIGASFKHGDLKQASVPETKNPPEELKAKAEAPSAVDSEVKQEKADNTDSPNLIDTTEKK